MSIYENITDVNAMPPWATLEYSPESDAQWGREEYAGGLTYALGPHPNGPLKLGYTTDPGNRIRQFQTGNALQLYFFATVKSWDDRFEKFLHMQFREVRLRGEWFALGVGALDSVCLNDWGVELWLVEEDHPLWVDWAFEHHKLDAL